MENNNDFVWTDELVEKYAEVYRFSSSRTSIKQFKEDFLPKKEYEIIEFISPHSGFNDVVFIKTSNGEFIPKLKKLFGSDGYYTETYLLKQPTAKIHSVKRLSDGEVFSIDDYVIEKITGKNEDWIIKEFSLKDTRCFSCGMNINNIEKSDLFKKPLLSLNDILDAWNTDSKTKKYREVYASSTLFSNFKEATKLKMNK